jgi:hypothetical protein
MMTAALRQVGCSGERGVTEQSANAILRGAYGDGAPGDGQNATEPPASLTLVPPPEPLTSSPQPLD